MAHEDGRLLQHIALRVSLEDGRDMLAPKKDLSNPLQHTPAPTMLLVKTPTCGGPQRHQRRLQEHLCTSKRSCKDDGSRARAKFWVIT